MSRKVASNTPLAGFPQGTFLDDLTDRNVGQWPMQQDIGRISRIVIWAEEIIDSVRITYEMKSGPPKTIKHGGDGGTVALDYPLSANQKVVAVYGRHLKNDSNFGKRNIVQLSFVIVTEGAENIRDPATVEIKTVSAERVNAPNVTFNFSWALVGVTSFTFQPSGRPNAYLQAIGFSEVLDDTDVIV